MRKLFKLLLIFSFAFFIKESYSQNEKFKALFMYNYTKYIEWPGEYQYGEFIIAVFGSSPIITELEMIAEKRKVGNQPIIIQQFSSISEIRKCHILYIPSNKSSSLNDILKKTEGISTLIITDSPGLANKGSSINYVLKGTQQDFEINRKAIDLANLKINSTLLSLGTVVSK